jgi:hypothetical protein
VKNNDIKFSILYYSYNHRDCAFDDVTNCIKEGHHHQTTKRPRNNKTKEKSGETREGEQQKDKDEKKKEKFERENKKKKKRSFISNQRWGPRLDSLPAGEGN